MNQADPICRVGCVALREEGGLVAALAVTSNHSGGKLCALTLRGDANGADAVCELITGLPLESSSCPNDGAIDPTGRCVNIQARAPHPCVSELSLQAVDWLQNAAASWPVPQRLGGLAVA